MTTNANTNTKTKTNTDEALILRLLVWISISSPPEVTPILKFIARCNAHKNSKLEFCWNVMKKILMLLVWTLNKRNMNCIASVNYFDGDGVYTAHLLMEMFLIHWKCTMIKTK